MYVLLYLILVGIGLFLLYKGIRYKKKSKVLSGFIVFGLTVVFFYLLDFWGEMLWFNETGYSYRFWKVILSKYIIAVIGGFVGYLFVNLIINSIPSKHKLYKRLFGIMGLIIGFKWGFGNWSVILKLLNKVPTELADPIINKTTDFYLFVLPFLKSVYSLFFTLTILSILFSCVLLFLKMKNGNLVIKTSPDDSKTNFSKKYNSFYVGLGLFLILLAFGKFLDRYYLLYSKLGAVSGPGWTDVNIRLPMYILMMVLFTIFGLSFLIPLTRKKITKYLNKKKSENPIRKHMIPAAMIVGFSFVIWFILLAVVPGLFQWLRVEPNEITFEKPYINHNIKFTRHGFNLHNVEERKFPVEDSLHQNIIQNNQKVFSNIRLWDWRALDAVYKQFQEIRLYYEFKDVDIDRYVIDDEYREVMVSARELELGNLPKQSQTFVNRRFKYTHGNGITMTNVSEFTSEGLPNLLIKDIPPKNKFPSLEVKQPQIYYGELTDSHVIANSKEKEFDYPSGEKNVYVNYSGNGGVPISNIWRKLLYGWKFDGTKLFLSNYPTKESRIMFHRQIEERISTIAPFLEYDNDPYVVLADGKLYWIIDAYTTSNFYPYSEPFNSEELIEYQKGNTNLSLYSETSDFLSGINYIRNSVKVVVDAYDGDTDFYIFDKDDPIIQVWDNIFPNFFKNKEDMPKELYKHVRYPENMILTQGLVYAKYHMTNPTVFYNQEDLWIRATEKYYNRVQPVEPYYIMWELPGTDDQEFVQILPFTPKKRQVMIGWIAGMCDMENYGRLLAYKFPKEKRVLGTQQVETKIDQDPFLSGQLTLWDQRGSNVIRGNVLAIPIEKTILYVEPIYLQAETAAYPELRLVVVMHNDNLSYGETFDKALQGLFEQGKSGISTDEISTTKFTYKELIKRANASFDDYLNYTGNKEFKKAGEALDKLKNYLNKLSNQTNLNKNK